MEILKIPFLTEEACKEIEAKVLELKPFWIQRAKDAGLPFYTLGQATYLDKAELEDAFYKRAEIQNRFLESEFSSFYLNLQALLEKTLKEPVIFEKHLAMPGFHIFLYHPAFTKPLGSIHFDLQHFQHHWPYHKVDKNPLSFTLAISLPSKGGGLNYWDVPYDPKHEWDKSEIEKAVLEKAKNFHPYKIGEIALHKGLYLHQIAPAEEMADTDMRITLQGHALFCDGAWRLYW